MNKTNQNSEQIPYRQPLDGGFSQMLINNQELVGYLPGTSCRIWYTHLTDGFSEHRHNSIEIIFGENSYYVAKSEESTYEIHRGDILLIPPDVNHSIYPQDGCNGFIFLIDICVLKSVKSVASFLSELTKPIFITEKTYPRLHATTSVHLTQMHKIYFSGNDMREMLVYSHLLALLAEIWQSRYITGQQMHHIRSDKRKESSEIFNEVLYYISQHYMEDLSVDYLAKRFNYSKYYFARLFKSYTSFTLYDYLNYQRLKAAEHLLLQPELSVTDIAYQTGFSNSSVFSRAFKKRKNCTPSEYRKLYDM